MKNNQDMPDTLWIYKRNDVYECREEEIVVGNVKYVRSDILDKMKAKLEAAEGLVKALNACRIFQVCDELDRIIDPALAAYEGVEG